MRTLTDRYIAEVVRRLPEDQREDIATEIAGTIEDMVAAEREDHEHDDNQNHDDDDNAAATGGAADAEVDAERLVLMCLGDPAALARRYSGARQYLIGPDVYPVWAHVLRWLLPIAGVFSASVGGILYASTTPDPQLGGLIGELISSVAGALLWVFAAWTLVVVIVERTTPEGARSPFDVTSSWDPDRLEAAPDRPETRANAVVSLVLLAIFAALPFIPSTFLYIGHLNGGERLVNPAIPTPWIVGYLLLIGVLALIQVWLLLRPAPQPGRLAVEVSVDVVFGVFLTALALSQDSLIHPELVPADGGTVTTAIRWGVVVAIWAIVIWDQFETVRVYRRAGR